MEPKSKLTPALGCPAAEGLTVQEAGLLTANRACTDLEALINGTPDLIWSLSSDYILIAANRSFLENMEDTTGIKISPGDNLMREGELPKDFLDFWKGLYDRVLAGEVFTQEVFIPTAFRASWLEIDFKPIYEADAITGAVCYSKNITERKLAEVRIREGAEQLAAVQRLTMLGNWTHDIKEDRVTWSEQLYDVFGVDRQKFKNTYSSFVDLIDPEDKEFVLRIGKQIMDKGEPYIIEYKTTTSHGQRRVIQEHGYAVRDSNGAVTRLSGSAQDITDRKQAERKLKQSELNYQSLFGQATHAIFIADNSLRFIDINPSGCLAFGYSKEEFIGLSLTDILFEEDLKSNPLKIADVRSGKTVRSERRQKRKDGSAVVMEVTTKMLEDGRWLMFGHDISERKIAEQALRESEARYRAVFENTLDGILLSVTDGEIIDANPAACAIFQMTVAEICKAGRQGILDVSDPGLEPLLRERRRSGKSKGEIMGIRKDGRKFPMEITCSSFTDGSGARRTSMIMRDITKQLSSLQKLEESEQKYRKIVETAQEGIWMLDPNHQTTFINKKMCEILEYTEHELEGRSSLSFKDEAETIKTLIRFEQRKRGLSETYETTFITKSGRTIHTQVSATPFLDDAGNFTGTLTMITDISDRKRAEQEMLWLINNTEESFVLLNTSLRVTSFNDQFRLLYGRYLGVHVAIGDLILNYVAPEKRSALKSIYDRVLQGQEENDEMPVILPDKSVKTFAIKYKPAKDEQGLIIGAFVSFIDITEKKRSAQELIISEKRFRTIVEHGADAIAILSPEGKPNYISPSIQRVLGFSESEAMELDLFSRIHPDDLVETAAVMAQVLMRPGETIAGHTGRLLHKNGTWRWLESSVTNMLHDPSINGIVDNFRDITEKKELENLLNKANTLARIGSWEVDVIKETLYWSTITKEIHGVLPDFVANLQTAITFYKKGESRDLIAQKVADAIEKNIPFDVELQIIDNDGQEKWVRALGEPEQFNGKCIKLGGSFQDITGRKNAETALQASAEEYKVLFVASPLPKWIYDLETFHIRDVNDAAMQHYGYTKEEFLEMSIMDIRPTEELPVLLELHQRVTNREGAIYFGIYTHQKKDKTKIKVEISGNPFTYHGIDCMMVISNDVTERELALKRLRDNEVKLLTAQKIARLGYWESEVNASSSYWSDELYEIWGVSRDLCEINYQYFLDSIHPDDKELFFEKQNAAFSAGLELDIEHRIVLPDGTVKWVHEKASMIKDELGKPLAFRGTSQDIDARKKTQIELQNSLKSLEDYRFALDESTIIAFTDKDGIITSVNDNFCSISGYEQAELEGRTLQIVNSKFHSREFFSALWSTISSGNVWKGEMKNLSKNNEYYWIQTTIIPFLDSGKKPLQYLSISFDVTEKKFAEETRMSILSEKIIILESIADAFFAVDKAWIITYWNNHAAELLNKEKHEALGLSLWDIFEGSLDSVSYRNYHQAVENGEVIHFEDYYAPLMQWYEISAYPSTSGLSVYFKDVTARKLSDIRVHELNEDLLKQAKALAVSNAELEQFAYVASHDLQEPLRMVTSFLAQLQNKYGHLIDEKGNKYIDFAVDGAKRMRQIILDLLEFSRIGRTDASRELLDLNTLVAEIRILFRRKIEDHDALIETDELPTIEASKAPLRQVFQNLIGNALKYRRPGVPVRIRIAARESETHWEFSVTDNGIGIEEEYFDKIFIIFQRLHNKDEFSGTGMGLAITKKIVETLGGKISVKSEPGKGSTFYFTLSK